MDTVNRNHLISKTLVITTSLILGACGGSGSDSTSNDETVRITGTAAIGAAISEAEVTAKCADGSGFPELLYTKLNGTFEGRLNASVLPCALKVSKPIDGIELHSLALTSGVTNITPLTDMVVSLAAKGNPSDWFESDSRFDIVDAFEIHKQLLLGSLAIAGFGMPTDDFDPFNQAFAIGDSADQLLDEIQESLADSSTVNGYDGLIDLIKDGNFTNFPLDPIASEPQEPEEPEQPADPDNTAITCFNPALYQQGASVALEYRVTADDATLTNEQISYDVRDNDGSSTTLIDQVLKSYSAQQVLTSTHTSLEQYGIPSNAGLVLHNNSQFTTEYADGNSESGRTMFFNADDFDFRVNIDEEFSSRGNILTMFDNGGGLWVVFRNGVTTYTGKEEITVPAGTFTACRFDKVLTYSGAAMHPKYEHNKIYNETESEWYALETGVLLKSMHTGGDTRELISATINGEDL